MLVQVNHNIPLVQAPLEERIKELENKKQVAYLLAYLVAGNKEIACMKAFINTYAPTGWRKNKSFAALYDEAKLIVRKNKTTVKIHPENPVAMKTLLKKMNNKNRNVAQQHLHDAWKDKGYTREQLEILGVI